MYMCCVSVWVPECVCGVCASIRVSCVCVSLCLCERPYVRTYVCDVCLCRRQYVSVMYVSLYVTCECVSVCICVQHTSTHVLARVCV